MWDLICILVSLIQLSFWYAKKKYSSWKLEVAWLVSVVAQLVVMVITIVDIFTRLK